MAVYTRIGAEDMAALIAQFDVGTLTSAKGIAEGVSNSNWLIETTGTDGCGARFILTVYEERTEVEDLPFFLGLLDHLAAAGCPVPRTIHDRSGAAFRQIEMGGEVKSLALIEFLPGVSADNPTSAQAHAVGGAMAQIHRAAQDFGMSRKNGMGHAAWRGFVESCQGRWAEIDPKLEAVPGLVDEVIADWPRELPQSVIHADLFPDNVLLMGDAVSGLIDFYFACTEPMAYDLAVAHAAWSFSPDGKRHDAAIGRALIEGYEAVRPLTQIERNALPLLAQGASLRFLLTRAYDWLNTPVDALVTRKDPCAFWNRLAFYRENGASVFA
ncbi:homoserine kinase [Croceicoccus naphthovorans]|uniref:Homoserine kinase n=1 Tax=Croceicoccus naphthovorans TaxID=1348774 RepID=A0A0G3XHV7_9SPHN|nr:homoserine kinase [Croceicoccus naphthovorans]AKM10787.1 serine kinase [Croceicoccus naphthovorans]MBB3988992.1 homoserine kinase type II [Croceicoccus naphthovorans]